MSYHGSKVGKQNLYCWTCRELIENIEEYVDGIHRTHRISTYSSALPEIKSGLMKEFHKGLVFSENLKSKLNQLAVLDITSKY